MTDRDLTQANTVRLAIEREIFGGQLAPGDALEHETQGGQNAVNTAPGDAIEQEARCWATTQ